MITTIRIFYPFALIFPQLAIFGDIRPAYTFRC